MSTASVSGRRKTSSGGWRGMGVFIDLGGLETKNAKRNNVVSASLLSLSEERQTFAEIDQLDLVKKLAFAISVLRRLY